MDDYNTSPITEKRTARGLPAILLGRRLKYLSRDTLYALRLANNPPELFVRGGAIVRFRTDEKGLPFLEILNELIMYSRLIRVADFYILSVKNGRIYVDPPVKLARDILSRGSWPFPAIRGIVEAPILRVDGSILTIRGYDPQTELYYFPATDFEMDPVPDHPTGKDVAKARGLLIDLFQDFPFKDQASLANMLGLVITPLVRPAIMGNIPLALINAPQAGTGKTILGALVSQIATGHDPTFLTYSQESEEMRKKITSALRISANVLVMDNIAQELNSEILASALTTGLWSDRLLGKNEILRLPQLATWIANGNNIRIGGDLPRRCYLIELDAKMSRPWKRSDFQHPDIIQWTIGNRPKLMWSVFAMVRAWVSLGKPEFSGPKLGSFTQWSNIVGGILEVAGVEGFLSNLESLYNSTDEEGSQWESFLLALQDCFPRRQFTTAHISEALLDSPDLVDSLPDELGTPFRYDGGIDHRFKQKLGIELKKRINTRFGAHQMYLDYEKDPHLKIAKWRIVCGDAGTSGTSNINSTNQINPISNPGQ